MIMYTVYVHKNKINGKCYVGITSKVPEKRWRNGLGYNPCGRENPRFQP